LEGERKKWHENGQLRCQEFYKNGQEEGECKFWHENGQLFTKIFYENGKEEGKYRVWHSNGYPTESCYYRDGLLAGMQKIWFSDGNVFQETLYLGGEVCFDIFTFEKQLLTLKCRHSYFRKLCSQLDTFLVPDLSNLRSGLI
jgi:antitoxin component YwqK of YwqJK toxin-antitoxin module